MPLQAFELGALSSEAGIIPLSLTFLTSFQHFNGPAWTYISSRVAKLCETPKHLKPILT